MEVPPHLISLYRKTARRYNKLISKIHRETVSSYERKTFLHQLKKLLRKLRDLQAQLKIAVATGAVVLLLNAGQAQAQTTPSSTLGPFVKQNRIVNPLPEPLFTGENPVITVVDFDKDGDLDVVQGEYYYWGGGLLRYFENQAAQGSPLYLEKAEEENPFAEIRALTPGVAPAFADIDEDGDLDLFLGQNGWNYYYDGAGSGIEYYRNDEGIFSKQTGTWNETTREGNPFEGLALGEYVRPVFVDFDKDGDQDCIIGSYLWTGSPTYETHYVHYYQNNGNGTFTSSPITFDDDPNSWGSLSPAVADVDKDGDYDLVLGSYQYGSLMYYRQETPGYFVRQNAEWDPVAKNGNPFYDFEVGSNASPAFVDFNQDGNLDLFVADEESYYDYKYSDRIINYYKNSAENVFSEIDGKENPFDGVYVEEYASPVLIDLDGDEELDAVIGNKYENYEWDYYTGYTYFYSTIDHYKKNQEGTYTLTPGEENPLNDFEVDGYFSPQFVDVDEDGDPDMITGNDNGQVTFFRNDDGAFVEQTESSPFSVVGMDGASSARLVDIDNDGDLDIFATVSYGNIRFWQNVDGTFQPEVNNPLEPLRNFLPWNIPAFLSFTDLDHDGDLDVVFNGYINYQERGVIAYFENTGTPEEALFELARDEMFSGIDTDGAQTHFVDYDADGDLDVFIGNYDGSVSYFQNGNEPVQTSITGATIIYEPEKDEPVVVVPGLTLSDPDNDLIVQAVVSIQDYQPGEVLGFTPHDAITAYFDSGTGMLHFNGKASMKIYETLLRTVTFEVIVDEGGRTRSPKGTTEKNINFAVYDIDFTNPQVGVKPVTVFVNTPPAIEPAEIITPAGSVKSLNLIEITSDIDGNLDPNSFSIVAQPVSTATATIDFVSTSEVNLLIDYQGITFSGVDQMTIRACDDAAACTDRVLAIEVDVTSGVVVFNAVAPNSSGDNKIMRITGLPEGNKVSIFNRWGDKVYEVENYQNISSGNAFQGLNQNGNALPSGVYYYTIEIPGNELISGYLTLKQ